MKTRLTGQFPAFAGRPGVRLVLLAGLLAGPARAQAPTAFELPGRIDEAPWWIGLPIAQVQLTAGAGRLPDESLAPLLGSRQGEPANPQDIRDDLETLFQAGEFSAVEAEVEEGFVYGPTGEPMAGVALTTGCTPLREWRASGSPATTGTSPTATSSGPPAWAPGRRSTRRSASR